MTSEIGVFLPGGKTGVLMLHDAGGSAPEMRALANGFARAGYSVCCPQLDETPNAQGLTGWAGHVAVGEAEKALQRLKARCDNLIVAGSGYGAMLALEVARQNAAIVQAVVMLEPRTTLVSPPGRWAGALTGRVPQTWFVPVLARLGGIREILRQSPTLGFLTSAGGRDAAAAGRNALKADVLHDLAGLLDGARAALASVTQPALLFHRQADRRGGADSPVLLQRKLGGRVESVMLESAGAGSTTMQDRHVDTLVERSARFIAAVLEEIETRRGNQLRRERAAAGRSNAA